MVLYNWGWSINLVSFTVLCLFLWRKQWNVLITTLWPLVFLCDRSLFHQVRANKTSCSHWLDNIRTIWSRVIHTVWWSRSLSLNRCLIWCRSWGCRSHINTLNSILCHSRPKCSIFQLSAGVVVVQHGHHDLSAAKQPCMHLVFWHLSFKINTNNVSASVSKFTCTQQSDWSHGLIIKLQGVFFCLRTSHSVSSGGTVSLFDKWSNAPKCHPGSPEEEITL